MNDTTTILLAIGIVITAASITWIGLELLAHLFMKSVNREEER